MRRTALTWGAAQQGLSPDGGEMDLSAITGNTDKGSFRCEGKSIYFYQGVSSESVAELVAKLKQLERDSLKEAAELELNSPRPIHLHIHSKGGCIFAGFAAMDAILCSKVPVYTYVDGATASAATFFSVVGQKRFIGPNSYVLIHQITSLFFGKHEEWKDEMTNQEVFTDKIKSIYEKHTKMKKDQVDSLLRRDLWLSAEKALEFGFVDEIL